MEASYWPERVDFPGESRSFGGWVDPNEYYLEVHQPRHYPNGPALPLDGPIPADHPVLAAGRAPRHAIRVHRDRFVEGRRFLNDRIAAGEVDAVHHWGYGEYCEMNFSNILGLLVTLEINLDWLKGTPGAEIVSRDVGEFMAILERGEHPVIRANLGITFTEMNPYSTSVLYGDSGEAALREFTGERYVPPIRYRLEGIRVPSEQAGD